MTRIWRIYTDLCVSVSSVQSVFYIKNKKFIMIHHLTDHIWIVIQMSILTAILHKEDDIYVAECPEVGTVIQGDS